LRVGSGDARQTRELGEQDAFIGIGDRDGDGDGDDDDEEIVWSADDRQQHSGAAAARLIIEALGV